MRLNWASRWRSPVFAIAPKKFSARSLDDGAAAGDYVSPFWRAALMLALGQLDEGYAQLALSYREGAPTMPFLGTGWLDVLRGQPRFVGLARRIGLPTSVALQRS